MSNGGPRHIVRGGVPELRAVLLPIAAAAEVVSFDVFDTLVTRRFGPPDQVKWLAARRLRDSIQASSSISIGAVLRLRDTVEHRLRRDTGATGRDGECQFTQLAAALALELERETHGTTPAPVLERAIVESEVAAETALLYADVEMRNLLTELKQGGKRIVAVSDMYLDGAILEQLLGSLGFAGLVDAIYVSSDQSVGKYSGRLFEHVFRAEDVAPSALVHVGDNEQSDYLVPSSLGAAAILFQQPERVQSSRLASTYEWLSERNPYWRGPHVTAQIPPATSDDFYYRYGYDVLGPIFSIFIARLREELVAQRIERVYFVAREGDLFRQIYSVFSEPDLGLPSAPAAGYLYLSRKAVALPAAHQGLAEGPLAWLQPQIEERGLLAIAGALGVEPEAFADVRRELDRLGFDQGLPRDRQAEWLAPLIADARLQTLVRERASDARALLRRYLEQEGFFDAGPRVALADVGWSGSIQQALQHAFGDDPQWPQVVGCYMSYSNDRGRLLALDEAQGMLFDSRRDHGAHSAFVRFEEIFENSARAQHGSTIGYRRLPDGRVEPVLADENSAARIRERAFDPANLQLRAGVLAYVRLFARHFANSGYDAEDLVPFALEVGRRAVFFPSVEEAAELLRMEHGDDIGSGRVSHIAVDRLDGLRAILRPWRLLRTLRRSNWRHGTARSLGLPGANHAFRRAEQLWLELIDRRGRRQGAPRQRVPQPRAWEFALLRLAGSAHAARLEQYARTARRLQRRLRSRR